MDAAQLQLVSTFFSSYQTGDCDEGLDLGATLMAVRKDSQLLKEQLLYLFLYKPNS